MVVERYDGRICTRDQQNVVLIHRWSLYAGTAALKVYPCGSIKGSPYKQVFYTGGLQSRFAVHQFNKALFSIIFLSF